MPTKDEIKQELDEVKKRNEKLRLELEAQRKETLALAEKDAGYLITCKNSLYSGTKYGIAFTNGQAFIRRNQEVPYFKEDAKPMSDNALWNFVTSQWPSPPHDEKFHKEKMEEIREREQTLTTAWRAVRALESDFGYDVKEYEPEDIALLQKRLNERAAQAKQIMEKQEQSREDVEKIVEPGYFGRPKG